MSQPEGRERATEPRTIPEGRKRARDRVRAVQTAAADLPEEGLVSRTRAGTVHIASVDFGKEGEVEWVDLTLAGQTEGGDPSMRIYNPPTLVSDPLGDIEVRGKRYRRDPLAALAELAAHHGGAQAPRKGVR